MIFEKWLFPLKCLLCGEPADGEKVPLCKECADEFARKLKEPCAVCGADPSDCTCYFVKNVSRKYFLMWYNDISVKRMIHKMKRAADKREIDYLAGLLAAMIAPHRLKETDAPSFYCVCNVPRSVKNVRRYGFDQAQLLAKALALKLDIPYVGLLDCTGKTFEQKTLSGALRTINTKGKYALSETAEKIKDEKKREIRKRPVLLVDDVSTSGATLAECAMVLKSCGFKEVQAAILAQTSSTKKFFKNN